MPDSHEKLTYNRRIRIEGGAGIVRADLEDDPHRYGVRVRHDGVRVLSVEGLPLRTPWTLCVTAAAKLAELEGMPLGDDFHGFYRRVDYSVHCTHMLDLAGLAIAHAGHGTRLRQYDFQVSWPDGRTRPFVAMDIDGEPFLRLQIDGTRIVSEGPFGGLDLRSMMPVIEARHGDWQTREAVLLLRRATFVSRGKFLDVDSMRSAADTGHVTGACFVFQPGVPEKALRVQGASRDFTHTRERMLVDLAQGSPPESGAD